MCTIYQHWVYTPIQGINLASIRSPALRGSQGFFFTLFVKLGHKHWWHLTETIKIWSLYVSSIYDINMEGTRVESRIIDSLPPSSYSRVLNKWADQLLVTEKNPTYISKNIPLTK